MEVSDDMADHARGPAQSPRAHEVGLALSGGGFRATLFHVGSLLRLNELGWLPRLSEITSVSGGSIAAGLLGLRWRRLSFVDGMATNFADEVVTPLRELCTHTADVGTILGGLINPFRHPSQLLARIYDRRLFNGATLQNLPDDGAGPRFTIYATSLQTGASVRFAKPYLGEYHLGLLRHPDVPLALAVAASSAFPPVYVPLRLDLDPARWERQDGADLFDDVALRRTMLLGDGGIYDNLGVERIWGSYPIVLVSDAGAPFARQDRSFFWRVSQISRAKRALDIIGEQTRALRRRRVVQDLMDGRNGGAYWGISTRIRDYALEPVGRPAPIVSDSNVTAALAKLRTRLNRFSPQEQGCLINWGYALTDAAMRRYVLDSDALPGKLPVAAASLAG